MSPDCLLPFLLLGFPWACLSAPFPHMSRDDYISPRFMILSSFSPEARVWYAIPEFNLLERNITLPGLSPLFPAVHCTASGEICQAILGESEINAASTMSALIYSRRFDLTKTYFMVSAISGVNPYRSTLNDVQFARYAVQVAMQQEIDPRELPANYTTGYIPYGSFAPDQYPSEIYGTEVFELSQALQRAAADFARRATLQDTDDARAYRAKYSAMAPADGSAPSVRECDVATTDNFYAGELLAEAMNNFTTLITNGTGRYCMTAQEDTATMEVLVRAAKATLVDFGRVIIMRTGNNFDRNYPGQAATDNLYFESTVALQSSSNNIYLAGREVIKGILDGWNSTFEAGLRPNNYIGDIFNTLGGEPDFGLPEQFVGGLDQDGSGGLDILTGVGYVPIPKRARRMVAVPMP